MTTQEIYTVSRRSLHEDDYEADEFNLLHFAYRVDAEFWRDALTYQIHVEDRADFARRLDATLVQHHRDVAAYAAGAIKRQPPSLIEHKLRLRNVYYVFGQPLHLGREL